MTVPQLPYDLERTIIEYAAEIDKPVALKLILISREVKRWIEPILYRHITLKDSLQADAFIRTLDSFRPKPPISSFPKSNSVKSISFTYGVTLHQAARILSTCRGITCLSTRIEFSQKTLDMTLDDIEDFRSFMMTPSAALRRLAVTLRSSFLCPDPNFRTPIFRNLTHLSIFGVSGHWRKWSWAGLDTLEHLTHLALEIDISTPLQAIYNLIQRFPPLLRACLLVLSAKHGGAPLEQFLVDNREFQQLVLGDLDRRIVVGTTDHLQPPEMKSWLQHLVPVSKWDDTFGDREAWERVESAVSCRYQKYTPGDHN